MVLSFVRMVTDFLLMFYIFICLNKILEISNSKFGLIYEPMISYNSWKGHIICAFNFVSGAIKLTGFKIF